MPPLLPRRVLVLGHRGMLGNAVVAHFSASGDKVDLVSSRWGEKAFESEVRNSAAEFAINCIGRIPQNQSATLSYDDVNVALPIFLETSGKRVIHASTDCEFSGHIPPGQLYSRRATRDARDAYGRSKARISQMIEENFSHTKIIRTSIIGHGLAEPRGLLDWFLSAEGSVSGYTNHYWNGITTVQWASLARAITLNWDQSPTLTQAGLETALSKYDLLCLVRELYGLTTEIIPTRALTDINRALEPDVPAPPIRVQLESLRAFRAAARSD